MTTEEVPEQTPEENQNANALVVLETLIGKGSPPDYASSELSNKGIMRICFRWETGTLLHVDYEAAVYIAVLSRFLDFWGPSFPTAEPTFKEFKDRKGGNGEKS